MIPNDGHLYIFHGYRLSPAKIDILLNTHWIFTSLRDGNRPHRIVGQPLVTANDVGHWDQKHPKVLIVGKKNAKNLIAMYSGPTQFKK